MTTCPCPARQCNALPPAGDRGAHWRPQRIATGQFPDVDVLAPNAVIVLGQPELVQQGQRRGVHGVAAEVAQEVGVLLQHRDLDPRSGRDRRAIEVYPHAATVALFRLGRTLKYKNKPGRVLEQMRAELLLLIGSIFQPRPSAYFE